MPKIFISYRRADSRKEVGRIYDRMVQAFGKVNVFKDVDNIPPGSDFAEVLRSAIRQCDVVLVVIGPQWLTITDSHGNKRLSAPDDFVRIEVEEALKRDDCLVIPLLVDGATIPSSQDLPSSLEKLRSKNAAMVRDDPDFNNDIARLTRVIQRNFPDSVPDRKRTNRIKDIPPGIAAIFAAVIGGMFLLASVVLPNLRPNTQPTNTTTAPATVTAMLIAPTNTETALPPTSTSMSTTQSSPTLPTDTPITAITPAANTYPCDAQITSNNPGITTLNVVRNEPRLEAKIVDSVRRDDLVIVREHRVDRGENIWYQIETADQTYIGWIAIEYLRLSANCPKP